VPGLEAPVSIVGDAGIGGMLGLAVQCCAASALYLGRPVAIPTAYRQALAQRWALLRLLLLWWLFFVGAVTLGVLPIALAPVLVVFSVPVAVAALWLTVTWSLSVPALVLENRDSAGGALNRSKILVTAAWWRTLLTLLLLIGFLQLLPWTVLDGLLQLIADLFADQPQALAATAVRGQWLNRTVSVFTTPWLGIGLTLLYYDRRIRTEGYDLAVRIRALLSS
jgi:hypothetical protein